MAGKVMELEAKTKVLRIEADPVIRLGIKKSYLDAGSGFHIGLRQQTTKPKSFCQLLPIWA
jgi:hypothetical protein